MKKNVFLIFSIISCVINAQEIEKNEIWDFPVKPGSAEWASFTTSQQMLDACQIPPEILEELSTKELAEICMNYPFLLGYMGHYDPRRFISFLY